MSQGASALKQQTLKYLIYCGIVCCQQNMRVFLHRYQKYVYLNSDEELQIYVPEEFIDEYGLERKIHKGFLYCEINKGIYVLPQASKLANTLLKQLLATCGYIKCMHATDLWQTYLPPSTIHTRR